LALFFRSRWRTVISLLVAIPLFVTMLMHSGDAMAQPSSEPRIRVMLVENAASVTFKTLGDYELLNEYTGAAIASPRAGEVWTISRQGSQVQVVRGTDVLGAFRGPLLLQEATGALSLMGAGNTVSERTIREGVSVISAGGQVSVLPTDSRQLAVADKRGTSSVTVAQAGDGVFSLEVNGTFKRYRGELRIISNGGGLLAVNTLPMEHYLYSVVPSEVLYGWPEETYKAQAVAARSFALYNMRNREFYDVCPTDWSQVYHGYDQERAATTRAVEATRGEILAYGGKPIEAYFHASSGGYTEFAEEVWRYPVPYLRPVIDPYDVNNLYYNWQVTYSADQLKDQLARLNYSFSTVADLDVMAMTSSGHRVKRLLVEGTGLQGESQRMVIENADQVRRALGLRSSLFTMQKETDPAGRLQQVTFHGNGWGHGLGMAQWGAYGMAKQGWCYRDILHHYYKGVTLEGNYGRN